MRRSVGVAIGAVLLFGAFAEAGAQRRRGGGFGRMLGGDNDMYEPPAFHGNVPYDGRFTFARIRYRGYAHFSGREGPGWSHDYPDAEENFSKILRDVTAVHPFVQSGPMVGSVLVAMDDPLVFKYPVSYMSEPGGWSPSAKELAAFRAYVLKGGFMIFDDFREGWNGDYDFSHLKEITAQAFPGLHWIQLKGDEPVFDSFFKIDMKATVVWPSESAYGTEPPTYWGLFQDNDPKKRMMLIANVDNDIGESWQWSGTGFVPIEQANEIYKLGINYVIYALTH
jgi:hypothetical protein